MVVGKISVLVGKMNDLVGKKGPLVGKKIFLCLFIYKFKMNLLLIQMSNR